MVQSHPVVLQRVIKVREVTAYEALVLDSNLNSRNSSYYEYGRLSTL